MAVIQKDKAGIGWRERRWEINDSGTTIETLGYSLSGIFKVDTANSDSIIVEVSIDGTEFVEYAKYVDVIAVSLPKFPFYRVSFNSSDSKAWIYGIKYAY